MTMTMNTDKVINNDSHNSELCMILLLFNSEYLPEIPDSAIHNCLIDFVVQNYDKDKFYFILEVKFPSKTLVFALCKY